MFTRSRTFALVLGTTFLCSPASAVELALSHSLGPKLDGFPRVVGDNPVAHRINTTLQQAEERLGRAVKACGQLAAQSAGNKNHSWERSVRVETRGPRFLSLVATDESFCGGAHPDSDSLALVFDLKDGSLANWNTLLPPSLAEPNALADTMSGGKVALQNADALSEAYARLYPTHPQNGISEDDWASCGEVTASVRSFVVWPSASPHGLAIQTLDLPHVVAACAVPVVIPTTALRGLGISDELAAALDSGR